MPVAKRCIRPIGLGGLNYAILFCNRLQYWYKKTRKRSGVCHSPPFWNESPFHPFVQIFQPELVVDTLGQMGEMEPAFGLAASRRRRPRVVRILQPERLSPCAAAATACVIAPRSKKRASGIRLQAMHPTDWIGIRLSCFVTVCNNVTTKITSDQTYATPPPFLDNLHFDDFVK